MPLARLLGPVDVVDSAGVAHAPNSSIRCTLLALLALEVPRAVDATQLLDQAWDGTPPDSGVRALRFHISRLRAELCIENLITTVGSGYRLEANTDVAMVENGLTDPNQLASLIALWRGESLTGCTHVAVLEHEQQRLSELRLSVSERYYQHRLDAGDVSIISDLTRLCLDQPLREDLWALLITAHYRSGHQAEALRAYSRLRLNLQDELGVDPSSRLQQLEHDILDQNPDLDRPGLGVASPQPKHRPSHWLPRPRGGLIGRDEDLDRLIGSSNLHQLVTVTGAGGIGKTSLALAAAHELAGKPDREVWWCDLAPVRDGDVAFRAGQAIGLTTGTKDPVEVGKALGMRGNTWLVLDNCEHVIDETARLADAVIGHSDARIVATSRVPMSRHDGQVLSLGPLDPDSSATEMFLGLLAKTGQDIRPEDLEVMRTICRRVDGIPLAIELAAARTRALSLTDIDLRLERLLTAPPTVRDSDARHETMSAAIETSVELLDPPSTTGLGSLAVFEGGFDLDAAEAILADEIDDPTHVIEELVTHNLLTANPASEPMRYRLLEPIRQYAAHHLWENPDGTRHRHLDHYVERLESAYETLAASSCWPILDVMKFDVDNLGAVHNWALLSGRVPDDLRLYRPLSMMWIQEWTIVGRWADETLDKFDLPDQPGWGAALYAAVTAALNRFDFDRYAFLISAAAPIRRDHPDRDLIAIMEGFTALMFDGEWNRARERFGAANSGDPYLRFTSYYFGSLVPSFEAEARDGADLDVAARESIAIVEAGINWAQGVGATNFEAALTQQLAQFMGRSGRFSEMVAPAKRAVELGAETGTLWAEHAAYQHLVEAAIGGADTDIDTQEVALRAIESGVRLGVAARLTYGLKIFSRLLASAGRHDEAALCFGLETVGDFDYLPRLALDDIPTEIWEHAKSEAENLTAFEIAQLAAKALREIIAGRDIRKPDTQV